MMIVTIEIQVSAVVDHTGSKAGEEGKITWVCEETSTKSRGVSDTFPVALAQTLTEVALRTSMMDGRKMG